jgi:hypothetical protein
MLSELRWAAQVMRMEKTRNTRKITEWTPHKARPAGRPRLRWMDQVEEDGQADMIKLPVDFRNFANAPNNIILAVRMK